jgi:hypothetical protein
MRPLSFPPPPRSSPGARPAAPRGAAHLAFPRSSNRARPCAPRSSQPGRTADVRRALPNPAGPPMCAGRTTAGRSGRFGARIGRNRAGCAPGASTSPDSRSGTARRPPVVLQSHISGCKSECPPGRLAERVNRLTAARFSRLAIGSLHGGGLPRNNSVAQREIRAATEPLTRPAADQGTGAGLAPSEKQGQL